MFTWNFQLVSKTRIAETFSQLRLDGSQDNILIRIHTAIHNPSEAVELARYIKKLVPGAHIFGTSTSDIIIDGRVISNQCIVSVTQMEGGSIRTAMLPILEGGDYVSAVDLCSRVGEEVVGPDTKLLLTFFTISEFDVYNFVDKCNGVFPGVQMLGGIAAGIESNLERMPENTFIFDEKRWMSKGVIFASLSGEELDVLSQTATGVECIGEEVEITKSYGTAILEIDNCNAGTFYRNGIGNSLIKNTETASLFPYVCSDRSDYPIFFHYFNEMRVGDIIPVSDKEFYEKNKDYNPNDTFEVISGNHHLKKGQKLRRAFIHDKKIISDNRKMFRQIESFEKSETLFAYSCIIRSIIYTNCIKWELSVYHNSNMSGCITYGEIVSVGGKNRFVNGTFAIAAMGEKPAAQEFNPYTFFYTESLADDNVELLDYLTAVEREMDENKDEEYSSSLLDFVRNCEQKMLHSDKLGLPNLAALNIDMKLHGVDRVCVIDVVDMNGIDSVFSEQLIDLTYKNYISKCDSFAKSKGYHMYVLQGWRIAVAAESYKVALSDFASDMETLQKKLFYSGEQYISIVPNFSVIDNCTNENFKNAQNSSGIRMWQKNIQFIVWDAQDNQLDAEAIRENYHMVNVINYAIANDRVIPHYQGIYDNVNGYIHHYEALMRLEDETGKIYYPNSFLDVARKYGLLYDSISLQMIKKVFDRFKDSRDNSVSLNLGIRDIRNKEITDFIYDFLSVAKYPENFIFELLENEDIDDYNLMVEFVDKIHELGAKISIDDFGSGFSNLQHIINLQSDIVKIDGSIVRNCCDNVGAENLIALISTWKSLANSSISIIAEFVENEEIQKKLLNYNIDYSQGYLFSKPTSEITI